jgi:hypothetical protein
MSDTSTSTPAAAAPAAAASADATKPAAAADAAGTAGSSSTAEAAAAKAEEAQHTLKVGGKERKVTTAELVRLAQLNENAELTTKEARELEKRARGVLESFEKDPRGAAARALKEFGGKDLREVAIELLNDEMAATLEEERKKALDPDARELEELRAKEKKRAEDDKTAAEKKREAEVTRVQQNITQAVIATLEELPESFRKNDLVAQTALDAWAYVVENVDELRKSGADLKKITPKAVAAEVMRQLRQTAKQIAAHPEEPAPAAEAAAADVKPKAEQHPALTSVPQIRSGTTTRTEDKAEPRLTSSQLVRRATLGL